jgi:hypothetical protein
MLETNARKIKDTVEDKDEKLPKGKRWPLGLLQKKIIFSESVQSFRHLRIFSDFSWLLSSELGEREQK